MFDIRIDFVVGHVAVDSLVQNCRVFYLFLFYRGHAFLF